MSNRAAKQARRKKRKQTRQGTALSNGPFSLEFTPAGMRMLAGIDPPPPGITSEDLEFLRFMVAHADSAEPLTDGATRSPATPRDGATSTALRRS